MQLYNVLGIMSGTSLDGLDLAYCKFESRENKYIWSIENATTIPYPEEWQKRLQNLVNASALELTEADTDLGSYIGKEVKNFITHHELEPDLIACHGHTIFHQPQKKFSLQIGSGYQIMAESGCTVVNDFRSLDVALGGQGAPLVPIGDELLFSNYDFCLNLGGIANISARHHGKRVAFDICPANMVLNLLAQRAGKPYDAGGSLAAKGKLLPGLLATLNNLDFYSLQSPKSLGYEWVAANVFPLLHSSSASAEDLLFTFCTHMVRQVTDTLFSFAQEKPGTLLITGGGAYNSFFINLLEQELKALNIQIIVPDNLVVEFKEALIFAFLGTLRIRNEINCLASVTGARCDSSSGQVYAFPELSNCYHNVKKI